ncbi:sulfurtransferase complex subunit TusD [Dasania sp. GY-MA-18]|uniref:Sulfurtransferase complex subunit TusD n=1 Tax=Dasania phycosphaerae TaxID=2950436 RepID=A0A9J6RS86_9GAMM|nr:MULTISPECIES: sulfurtransferase complex subunit TusD [Dasania]MCR8924288.1 sulfurtransferase complex subunit TusD [Dasania sp. GY-MA-18]MCZ0866941.1 sulfurtransferase complex subunit TusD [Dasania phycosphaerae]MCZ0870445.1 sulfurtransferase complex subunit TusD [Dasania phycosphaerae]
MKFSLLVLAAPYSDQSVGTALRFAQTLLQQGHEIFRVFFYHNGVYASNALSTAPQDEANIPRQWQQLAQDHNIDMVSCIASALKRGVLDESEAQRYDQPCHNLIAGFELSGLGQLVEASAQSDRVVSFGA